MSCVKSNDPVVHAEYEKRQHLLPVHPIITIYVGDRENLQHLAYVTEGADATSHAKSQLIWLGLKDNESDLVLVFWHEMGHQMEYHCPEWFNEFLVGEGDGGVDWTQIIEGYLPEEHESEKRAWLFAFKVCRGRASLGLLG